MPMPIFDSLTKGVKDFFLEEEAAAAVPTAPPPAAPPLAGLAPGTSQPEQRHLDHVAQVLAGNGHDFGAFVKMVKSLSASGLSGPLLYQTAFNAFAALTGSDLPALLASAGELGQRLADDRAAVQQRHREKLGEAPPPAGGAPSPLARLREQEAALQAEVATLSQQLQDKTERLAQAQQQARQEHGRATAALASYELAYAAAAADLQAHQQATQALLSGGAGG